MTGHIFTADELTADVEVSCDVCIVGSGAGGSVLAAGLVERGLQVVIIEEGSRVTRRDFDLDESHAYPLLYQDRGTRATADLSMTILQGRGVGGSTLINWTTCFRTPRRILDDWHRRFGVPLDEATLAPHFEAVEARLNIAPWPEETANAQNQVLYRGCRALGWEVKPLRRNVRGCVSSGYCTLGCPVDGKQAMHVTYLPDALRGGLQIYANTRAERLEIEDGRVVAVHGRVMSEQAGVPDGVRVVVRPKVAVSSGGAINSPMLLFRSGLGDLGPLGKRTFLHPVVGIAGLYDEIIEPFYGAPQAAGSHQFLDRGPDKVGFFLEVPPLQPMLAGIAAPLLGSAQHELLAQLPHLAVLIAIHVDGLVEGDEGGTVTPRPDGRPLVDYPIKSHLTEGFHRAHIEMARISLAAGAREVRSMHLDPVLMSSETDLPKLDAMPYGAHEHSIFSAHQMGGCGMGADPQRSVVDPQLRHHHVDNLFVVDGSVFPTALGVNPSETIYGLARWATEHIAAAV